MNNGKFEWKNKDKKISELTTGEIIEINLLKLILPYLTFLTRYFPFSLLWQDRRFHHKYQDVVKMDELIVKIAREKEFWFRFLSFERYDKLLVILGKFIPLKKNLKKDDLIRHFEAAFIDKNIYISKQDQETVKFSIINVDK